MITRCLRVIVQRRKFIFSLIAAIIVLAVAAICYAHFRVHSTVNRVYTYTDSCPAKELGVILGTGPYVRGIISPTLQARLTAAVELYRAGKIKHILISGAANPEKYYSETIFMHKALVSMGIPEDAIQEDNLGVRTLDSILRVKHVYQQDDFIVISQAAHVMRALYLADHHDINCIAFAADNPKSIPDLDLAGFLRVPLANVKAVLDVIIHKSARYSYDTPQNIPL